MRLIDADLMRKQIMEAGKGMEKNPMQEVGERMHFMAFGMKMLLIAVFADRLWNGSRSDFMIAVKEGNSECLRCGHFNLTLGCFLCYQGELPKCGRNIILTQKEYRSLLLKNVKIAELVELCINGKISCENLLKSQDISRDKEGKYDD